MSFAISIPRTDSDRDLIAQDAAKGAGFKFLKLFTSSSDAVKARKVTSDHWAVYDKQKGVVEYSGLEVDVILLDVRSLAVDGFTEPGKWIRSFDRNGEVYARTMIRCEQYRAAKNSLGAKGFYGPEYLAYVPAWDQYVTIHLSSPSARYKTNKFHDLLPDEKTGDLYGATLFSEFVPKRGDTPAFTAVDIRKNDGTIGLVQNPQEFFTKAQEAIARFRDQKVAPDVVVEDPDQQPAGDEKG